MSESLKPAGFWNPVIGERTLEAQLANYATHGNVYEQVTAFQALLVNIVNIYVLLIGGLWAFILGQGAAPPQYMVASAWVFSLVVSAAAFLIGFAIASTIVQRLNFLQAVGSEFWPNFEEAGKKTAKASTVWSWGFRKQLAVWCLIPVVGAMTSTALMLAVGTADAGPKPICREYLAEVRKAKSETELERAIFFFNQADCSLSARAPATSGLRR